MLRRFIRIKILMITVLFLLRGILPQVLASQTVAPLLDPSRHITIDQVKPGMEAYCLTVYEDTKIEKFPIKVISVLKDFDPGIDIILVQGTDERFIHTGAVAGCSGSPVYIEGRLAGALALGWPQGKDPLYGVTPIDSMLQVGSGNSDTSSKPVTMTLDLSGPIRLEQIEDQIYNKLSKSSLSKNKITTLPCPLVVSGIPGSFCEQLNEQLNGFGIVATPGFSSSISSSEETDVKIEPGSVLTIPMVSGDIELAVTGTTTEVIGDKVYGFGHAFLGYGPVELPMAAGKIHTIVASRHRSFKIGSPLDIIGTITADQSRAVYGQIGKMPTLIPLDINIKRYNEPDTVTYSCNMAYNRMFTPLLARVAVLGAAMRQGSLPPENTVKYRLEFETFGYGKIIFENTSAQTGLIDAGMELNTTIALLMNNPYKEIKIKSIDCDIEIENESSLARIFSTSLSDYTVIAGDEIMLTVTVEKLRGPRKDYSFTFKIPDDLKPGKYKIIVTGGKGYQEFLFSATQQRLITETPDQLVEAIRYISMPKRNNIHCIMPLYQRGITIQRAELPDLPATKSLVLADPKRTLEIQSYKHWIEENIKTDIVIIDQREIEFMVIEE